MCFERSLLATAWYENETARAFIAGVSSITDWAPSDPRPKAEALPADLFAKPGCFKSMEALKDAMEKGKGYKEKPLKKLPAQKKGTKS